MGLWDDKPLFDRLYALKTQREKGYVKFNKARETIIDLMRPDLGSDIDPEGDGSFFGDQIYDGIGSWSVDVMAKGLQGGLAGPDEDWIDRGLSDEELAEVDEITIWLQDIKRHTTSVYRDSNFYEVLPAFTKDGISIGSPVMFIEETDVLTGEISFLPQFFKNVLLFYDRNNRLEGVIIKDDKWTVKQIVDQFAPTPEEQKEKLSTTINNEIRDGHYYKEHTIIRAVFKDTNPVWDVEGFNKPDAPWISVYFEDKTDEDRKNAPLETSQYFSRPFVTWDYDKKPHESISRTPAFSAVHDVHSSQQEALDLAENRKLKNRPPVAVNEDHRNIVDFGPEGITPINKDDWQTIPKVIDIVGDITLTRENLEFNAEKVKRWFHTSDFRKFTDMTETLRQQPTATQIIKIAAEIAVQVGPGIPSYTLGFLTSVDERIISIESRAGRGPFNPERMEEIAGIIANVTGNTDKVTLVPVFTGQLARAQKIKAELDPILEGMGVIGEMSAIWPNIIHAIRDHGTAQKALKVIGFPMDEFRPEDEYSEIVAAIQAAEAQAAQQQFMLEAAKASSSVSGPVDESSVLAGVANGG